MSSLEAMDHRLSFDDIMEAVQDSKRGRWFLNEFEARLKKQDTTSILQAISKLEARMEGLGAQSDQPNELGKVKTAIANARNDLLKMGVGKDALSPEGQLFANLAEMARKAMPHTSDSNAGVVRTLQLVAEIENTISPAPMPAAKFFEPDEKLFEKNTVAAAPKPTLVASTPPKVEPVQAPRKEETVATGAKLVIRRISETPTAQAEVPAEISPPPAPAPVVAKNPEATAAPRIVIIRRKAEDVEHLEQVSESAA
jgi:hypothetical protein